ncbi:hypothetical protein BO82DRAFT_359885 [Aspergillus uvarum CBS 121591]|uniref:Uncharacterized protein n=1 Tax=Aspergillus uvarum CBS 121591 TaxID=1448315 RepID=A0A319BVR0_9EURO|nr:hypothetical protein BO82DRAFT_359885 [Aspergillus uvarum CBS 121591]PYH75629.1 hypothetical protein BO82DRAFT_359885 [Aspergillus uvarum CBS 121591]
MGELCHGQFRHFLGLLANTCAVTKFLIEKGSDQLYLAAQEFTRENPELLQYIMNGPHTTIIRRDELSLPPKGMDPDSSTHHQPQTMSTDIVAEKDTSSQDHPTPSRSEIFAPVTPMPQKSELPDSDSVPAMIAATAPEKEQTTPTVTCSPQNMEGGTQVEKLNSQADIQADDGSDNRQESPESQKTLSLPIAETNSERKPSLDSPCRTNSVSDNELSTGPFPQPYHGRVVFPQNTLPQQQSIANYTMIPDVYGPQSSMVYNMPIQLLAGSMQAGQTLPSFTGQIPTGPMVMSGHVEQSGVDVRLINPYHSHVAPSAGLMNVNASVPSTFLTAAQLPSMAQGSTFHTALPSVSGPPAQHPGGPAYVSNLTGSEGLWETGATGPLGGYIVPSDMC